MAFKNLSAFGAGEITPELFERGNLDKFRTGLKRLRNATVTKTGGLKGRGGTTLHITPEFPNQKYVGWFVKEKAVFFEITHRYIRKHYNIDPDTLKFQNSYTWSYATGTLALVNISEVYLDRLHFTNDDNYLYIFQEGYPVLKVKIDDTTVNSITELTYYTIPLQGIPYTTVATVDNTGWTAPTGYAVDYAQTWVVDGVETFIQQVVNTRNIPANVGEANRFYFTITKASITASGATPPDEMRIYRRPRNGGGWSLITVAYKTEDATNYIYSALDLGGASVGNDNPPEYVSGWYTDTNFFNIGTGTNIPLITSKTGMIYQGRLVVSGSKNKKMTFASRTNSEAMTRDFPLQGDSAVSFKAGSQDGAVIKRYLDARGLMLFTNVGIYETPSDLLVAETAYGVKRSSLVIDEIVAPMKLDQTVVVWDDIQKAIMGLIPSDSSVEYDTTELSIFSNHLLKNRRIVSWDAHSAEAVYVWMVLDNGKMLSLSYHKEHQLQGWAWHDTDGKFEYVKTITTKTGKQFPLFFVRRSNGVFIERLTSRSDRSIFQPSHDPDNFLGYVGSDSSVVYNTRPYNLNPITISKTAPGNTWYDIFAVTTNVNYFLPLTSEPVIFRIFRDDGASMDIQLTAVTDGQNAFGKVLNGLDVDQFFNNTQNTYLLPNHYDTFNKFTGLDHLNGKKVVVRLDGFTHSSPLNTKRNLPVYTVVNGAITLENGERGAIASIGLPYVTDIETLQVDTVEQAPTRDESMIVNSMYLSYFESLQFYAGANYPKDDTVTGMETQDFDYEGDDGILSTVPAKPFTERREVAIEGDWKAEGSVALRNVDPQPVHLRGITLDLEVKRR